MKHYEMLTKSVLANPYASPIIALGVVLLFLALGFASRHFLIDRLQKLTSRTRWKGDDVFAKTLKKPLPLWFMLAGMYIAVHLFDIPPRWESIATKVLSALLIISLTFWASEFGVALLLLHTESRDHPITGIVQNIMRVAVFALGGLVLLNTLGISITPILTTLGIGGLAVALGLQDTMANFLRGFTLPFPAIYVRDILLNLSRVKRDISRTFVGESRAYARCPIMSF